MGMQISKLNSLNSSRIPTFKSYEEPSPESKKNDELKFANDFAKLSDAELLRISAEEPSKKLKKTAKDLVKTMFVAVPLVDIAATGIITKGNLSSKLRQSIAQTGRWGAVFAAGAAIVGIKHAVNSRSEEMKNIDRNHPILAFGMDFGAILGGYMGLVGLKNISSEFIKDNYTKTVTTFKNKLADPLKTALNNSFINKKLIVPAEQKLYRKANGSGRGLAMGVSLLAPTIAIAGLLKGNSETKTTKEQIGSNYAILKQTQNLLKAQLEKTPEPEEV